MSKTETLMGQPYTLGDATIVPIHRLRVALGAGAVHGGAKQDASSGESGAQPSAPSAPNQPSGPSQLASKPDASDGDGDAGACS